MWLLVLGMGGYGLEKERYRELPLVREVHVLWLIQTVGVNPVFLGVEE